MTSCCCNRFPNPTTSCCRPIYSGCVGKTYEFKFRVSVRMICPNFPLVYTGSGVPSKKYICQNNPNIQHDIMNNNLETFEFKIYYTITQPVDIAGLQTYLFPSEIPGSGQGYSNQSFYNSGACIGIPPTTPCYNTPPSYGCSLSTPYYAQECINIPYGTLQPCCSYNGPYTTCSFTEGYLRPDCGDCVTPYPINTPVTDPWSACYSNYILKSVQPQYEEVGMGCKRIAGNANLVHNTTPIITFIPNPNYPEQLDPDYIPKIEPKVIEFNFLCKGDHKYDENLDINNITEANSRYYARAILGFGYINTFNCGVDANNEIVNETLDLPYFTIINHGDSFEQPFPWSYGNGLTLQLSYTRFSLNTDPMNSCIPVSSQNVILTDSINSEDSAVDTAVLDITTPEVYADEYSLRSVYFRGDSKFNNTGSFNIRYDYWINPLDGGGPLPSYAPSNISDNLPGWTEFVLPYGNVYDICPPENMIPIGYGIENLYCHQCPQLGGWDGGPVLTRPIDWSQFVKISPTMQVTEI